jgi:DEAD/DEAH box helicase domain-containing protein
MDKLVIDIETKNTFADVGGQNNIHKLEVSFVGVYSYNQDKYLSFYENQLDELAKLLQKSGLVIGFSINRFDIPVLEKHCNFNIFALPRLDLLDEIEMALGHRISLDMLAKANLGIGKTHNGLEAIKFYKEGNLEELKNYCLHDVKITKDLYDLAKKQGHLLVPKKYSDEIVKANFNWKEQTLPATLF